MKPTQWNQWSPKRQKAFALYLIEGPRGHYLLAEALYIASRKLKDTAPSDAQDMELIGKTLFGQYWRVEEIATELAKHYGRNSKTSNRRDASNPETAETED